MAESRERTAEEREAARREREARRAAELGQVVDDEPIAASGDGELDGEHVELEEREEEAASGTRWVRGVRTARVQPQPRAPRAARPPRPPRVQRPRRRAGNGPAKPHAYSRRGRIFALIALILATAIVWFCVELFQPFHSAGYGSVTVVIPAHSSAGSVGGELERDDVISSGFFFELRATLAGERGSLRAGTYHLKRDMSYGAVLAILTKAPPAAKVTDVTVIPGRTRRQLDALLRQQGISGSYYAQTRSSRLLAPSAYGAPRGTNSLEGFLFPDTYQLREPISIAALVNDQLTTFKQRFATVNLSYARSKHLTAYDVLIVASMIEGEAQTAKDRALVASVIYNRLRLGMPLQLDATTRYATNNYTGPLTVSQLNSPSPYNTRIHAGLPPTPIDSPGLASIQAAAHPANTNYLYFVVQACGNGAELFTSKYQQFLHDSQLYQSARAKQGERSPTHC